MILALFMAAVAAVQDGEPTVALPPDLALPVERPARPSRPIVDRPESGPSLGGFLFGSAAVFVLLGGSFLLLRRYGKKSSLLGGGEAIRVLARKPINQKQVIYLVEVGAKVFMIGSTRDHLTTLGQIDRPDEVAALRADLPGQKDDSLRESLREGIKEEEAPPRTEYASLAGELAEIRKTVRSWKV
jgi:flagellar biogenesis protein FliO